MLVVYGLRQDTLMLDTLPCTGDLCMVSEEVCVIEVLLVSVGCGGFYFKVVVVGIHKLTVLGLD